MSEQCSWCGLFAPNDRVRIGDMLWHPDCAVAYWKGRAETAEHNLLEKVKTAKRERNAALGGEAAMARCLNSELDEARRLLSIAEEARRAERRLRADAESELEAYRSGLAAGFGICTADPHKTLVELGIAQERHHQEHHEREERLRAVVAALLGEVGRMATDGGGFSCTVVDEARAALEEQ